MLMTLSAATWADLKVGNVSVTATGNVNPTGLKAGNIYYDASTNTLTLTSVNYVTSETYAIRCTGTTKLTIVFKGENYIESTYGTISCSGPDIELYGSGGGSAHLISIDPSSGYFTPLTVYAKEMYIHDMTLKAEGNHYAINGGTAGSTPRQSTLKISNANVKATISSTTTGDAALAGFKSCTLTECAAIDGTYYDSAKCGFKAAEGDDFAKSVVIKSPTPYQLWILGKQVTDFNAADVLGDGTVSYDDNTKTLTLNGATLQYNTSSDQNIKNYIPNLNVNVIGDNTITNERGTFFMSVPTTIYGSGTLTLKSKDDCCIYAKETNLTIKDVTIDADGVWGIAGFQGKTEILTIENATIRAKGSVGAICDFKTITLGEGVEVLEPEGGSVNGGNIVDAAGNVAIEVLVGVNNITKYELYVNDTQVTSGNAADILGDGKVVYDAEANELTLDGAALTGIQNEIPNLKVIVKGDNTIENNADNVILIDSYENITFEGDGTLNLKSTNKTSLGMRLAATYSGARSVLTMLLQGPAFNITAGQGLFGTGFNPILNIYYPSKLKYEPVEGGNANPISGFLGFNFSRLTMVEPEGAYYSTSNRYVQYNDARYTGPLVIDLETYKLWIAGTQVSEVNKDDILGDGVFSYVSWYKTLHIKGDYANTADCRIIDSNIEDLIISVDATSKLTTANDDYAVIYLKYNTEIQGMGALTLESVGPGQRNIAIYQEFGDKLTISNANIEVGDGFAYAITGEPNVALEVINSDIVAKAHYIGCFRDFGSMTLNGCYIDSPRGAVYTDGALVDADGHIIGSDVTYETVVIKRGADAVGGLATDAAPADVFDVAGRKLDTVGRGINIVRSADGRVRKVLKK